MTVLLGQDVLVSSNNDPRAVIVANSGADAQPPHHFGPPFPALAVLVRVGYNRAGPVWVLPGVPDMADDPNRSYLEPRPPMGDL